MDLAAQHGIQPTEAHKHFPDHTVLVLQSASTWAWGGKLDGKVMKITYTDKVKEMEQVIMGLNSFLDQLIISGGTHRGYYRQFECGDHEKFDWNLGGRVSV